MTSKSFVKQLDDSQLEDFDWEFVGPEKQARIRSQIIQDIGPGPFRFIDVGGGNGAFSDWLLEEFPLATGVVLDNSKKLLAKNRAHDRKLVVHGSATDMVNLFDEHFDVVFFNYVLHHLVTNGYQRTRAMQIDVLRQATALLTEAGKISIIENIYDGPYLRDLPGFLIFTLTSIRSIAPIIRRLGANTAGIGVCFLSKQQWQNSLDKAGLSVASYSDYDRFNIGKLKRIVLHLGDIRGGQFWCSPNGINGSRG